MNLNQRKSDFIKLGRVLEDLLNGNNKELSSQIPSVSLVEEVNDKINNTFHYNAWFTPESIKKALKGISYMLREEAVDKWISNYPLLTSESTSPKNVGIVMAGNIPLVGFHDFLSVLLSGNRAYCKLSSSDDQLWPVIFKLLILINKEYEDRIVVVARLKGIDAVIATGSNNTSRYFDYYFAKYPHIIRKNRNAVSVLKGDESNEELKGLADDVFSFFGLGCRNVSKIYLPDTMDLNQIITAFYDHNEIIHHNKYANNFDYNKTVMLLNQEDILENGFILFKNSEDIASPLATLFYEYYQDYNELLVELSAKENEIQCIVGKGHIDFGKAQLPELWEYADGVDTMKFLTELD